MTPFCKLWFLLYIERSICTGQFLKVPAWSLCRAGAHVICQFPKRGIPRRLLTSDARLGCLAGECITHHSNADVTDVTTSLDTTLLFPFDDEGGDPFNFAPQLCTQLGGSSGP